MRKPYPLGKSERSQARREEAIALRQAGKTYREIGEHFGVCQQRARQLVGYGAWMRYRLAGTPPPPWDTPDELVRMSEADVGPWKPS